LEIISRHQPKFSVIYDWEKLIYTFSALILVGPDEDTVVALDASYPLIAMEFAHSKKAHLFGIYTFLCWNMFFAT
jgi:hypothetical protein